MTRLPTCRQTDTATFANHLRRSLMLEFNMNIIYSLFTGRSTYIVGPLYMKLSYRERWAILSASSFTLLSKHLSHLSKIRTLPWDECPLSFRWRLTAQTWWVDLPVLSHESVQRLFSFPDTQVCEWTDLNKHDLDDWQTAQTTCTQVYTFDKNQKHAVCFVSNLYLYSTFVYRAATIQSSTHTSCLQTFLVNTFDRLKQPTVRGG